MAGKKLKVAIFSATGMNLAAAEGFAKHPKVEIVAVTEDDGVLSDSSKEWASNLNVPFMNFGDVLKIPGLQVVSYTSDMSRRVEIAEQIASSGINIFGDKPLTEPVSEGDEIMDIVKKYGVKMGVGHNYRFEPSIRDAKVRLTNGDVGLPWAIHSDWIIATGKKGAPIGETKIHGMYPLDAMLYLIPEKVISVYAIAGSYFFDNSKDAGVDDLSFITMNMERGIIATLALGRTPHPHPNGYGGDQTIRIMGTHGMLYIDANRPSWMSVGKSGSSNKKYHHDNIYHMVDHYVNSLLNGTDHMGTEKDARDTLEITLAALESAQNNRLVTL